MVQEGLDLAGSSGPGCGWWGLGGWVWRIRVIFGDFGDIKLGLTADSAVYAGHGPRFYICVCICSCICIVNYPLCGELLEVSRLECFNCILPSTTDSRSLLISYVPFFNYFFILFTFLSQSGASEDK
jgi:hypothetical protein